MQNSGSAGNVSQGGGKEFNIIFWKQAPFLSGTKRISGWAAFSRVRDKSSGAVHVGLWDLLSHIPQSSKCMHGMLTHMLDIRKTTGQETSICSPSKNISLGKQAGAAFVLVLAHQHQGIACCGGC